MTQDYWEKRTKKYGHTGWASPIIYAFDNPIRIKIIDYLIEESMKSYQNSCLLDFGCGIGEFAKSQEERFQNIVLYDKCNDVLKKAEKLLKNAKIFWSFERLRKDKSYIYDAIFSITVLQHIMDIREMESVLSLFFERLDEKGCLYILESFGEVKNNVNLYEKSWNYDDFVMMMEEAGFTLVSSYNFYKKDVYSEINYQEYSKRKDIILMAKIYYYAPLFIKNKILQIMEHISFECGNLDCVRKYLNPISNKAGSKFMVFRKSKSSINEIYLN